MGVIFFTRFLGGCLVGVGGSRRTPTVLAEPFVVVGEGAEEVHRRRTLANHVALVVDTVHRGFTQGMVMVRLRTQSLDDTVDTRQRITVAQLEVVDALLGVHVVHGPSIMLRPLLRLRPDQAHEHLLVRPAIVRHSLSLTDRVGPPRHGLPGLDDLSVVIEIVVVVPRAPRRSALVPDPRVDTHPPLPLWGDMEGLDDVEIGVKVGEDLPDEHVMGPKNVPLIPVLRQAVELIEVILRQIRVIERRGLDAGEQMRPALATVRIQESRPQPVMPVRIEQPDPLTRCAYLTETSLEFDEELLLHLLALVDHVEPKVIVLKLLRIVERQPVDHRTILELDEEVRFVVGLYHLPGNATPPRLVNVAPHQHVPRGRAKLWPCLPAYQATSAWVFHKTNKELCAAARGLAVAPTSAESTVLSRQTMKVRLLGIGLVRECDGDVSHYASLRYAQVRDGTLRELVAVGDVLGRGVVVGEADLHGVLAGHVEDALVEYAGGGAVVLRPCGVDGVQGHGHDVAPGVDGKDRDGQITVGCAADEISLQIHLVEVRRRDCRSYIRPCGDRPHAGAGAVASGQEVLWVVLVRRSLGGIVSSHDR